MPTYITTNLIQSNGDGALLFTPSSSAYNITSSAPSTPAHIDIVVSSHPISNLISNTELNPYLQIPIISGSNFTSGINQDLLIRFFTQSHIEPTYQNRVALSNNISGYILTASESLYVTQSSVNNFTFRDIPYTQNDSGSELRDKIFNIITGSSPYRQTLISASINSNTVGEITYYSCSIHYNNSKGEIHSPTRYTSSFSTLSSSLFINTINSGSGLLNFQESLTMPQVSASFQIQFDSDDPKSMVFSTGTSSLGYAASGRTEPTLMYFSSSGEVGFGTRTPKAEVDIKADSFIIRSIDGKNEFQMAEDGRITNKKYANSATSESIGAELILSYTPGTFDTPTQARVGETIGTINFLDESYNKALEGATPQIDSSHLTSGSTAQITSTVRTVMDSGAVGDFQIKLNADIETAEDGLSSFLTIDPVTHGQTVLFPYGITSDTNIVARGNIVGNGATDLTSMSDGTFAGTLQAEHFKSTDDIEIANDIFHTGDTDTKISFTTEKIESTADSISFVGNVTASGNISGSATTTLQIGGRATFGTDTVIINGTGGHITASGNISASGTIVANKIESDRLFSRVGDANTGIQLASDTVVIEGNNVDIGKFTSTYIELNKHVTASGNISASGTITAASFTGSFSGAVTGDATGLTGTPDISVRHITASGNISASGDITGLSGSFSKLGVGTTTPTATVQIIDGGLTADNTLNLNNRVKFRGDGAIFWGSAAAHGVLNWSGNDALIGGASGINANIYAGGGSKMFVSASGNIGIGTTSPSEKLTVEGNISASGDLTIGQNATIWATNTVGGSVRLLDLDSSNNIEIGLGGGHNSFNYNNAFYVAAAGNVGIGTTSPSAKLHVDGDAIITGTITAQEFHTEFVSASIMFESGSTKFGDTQDDIHQMTGSLKLTGSLQLGVGSISTGVSFGDGDTGIYEVSDDRLRIRLGGSDKFEFRGSTGTFGSPTSAGPQLTTGASSATTPGHNFTDDTNTGIGRAAADQLSLIAGGVEGIRVTTTGADFNSHITASGNISASGDTHIFGGQVGIDTAPAAGVGLHVKDDVRVDSTDGVATRKVRSDYFSSTSNLELKPGISGSVIIPSGYGRALLIGTSTPAAITEKLVVEGNISASGTGSFSDGRFTGKVGIGTTSPTNKLHIEGGNLQLSTNQHITWGYGGNNAIYGNDSSDFIKIFTNGSERLIVNSSGNVGIGTTTPPEKLTVEGNISASGDLTVGTITLSTGKIDYGTNTDVDTGTENIATATGAEAAFFDYVVKNSTNIRAGTITAATDGTNVEYNEISTVDLGDTSDIKLKVVLSSSDLILQATAASDNWNVSSFIRYMAL